MNCGCTAGKAMDFQYDQFGNFRTKGFPIAMLQYVGENCNAQPAKPQYSAHPKCSSPQLRYSIYHEIPCTYKLCTQHIPNLGCIT